MIPFREELRYLCPLNRDSIVLDVGAHKGDFTAEINRRYNSTIFAYEPVPEFFAVCAKRFWGNPKIRVMNYALGIADGVARFGVKGDMSGQFCTSPNEFAEVTMRDFIDVSCDILAEFSGIDLLKINAEGAEYDMLEAANTRGLNQYINRISVQFHTVAPDYKRRHAAIRASLAETHDLEYDEPFIWTGWVRR